ncbi:MAG: ABC transporter ATP-binding protein [Actinomycetes bacterium]
MPTVSSSDTAIEVIDLHKSYGETEAVAGLSFEVRRGEVFGLLGPNGAGKTTTVEILEGYRARTSGTVTVLGLDPQGRPRDLRERVGIVLQNSALYANLTVHEALSHFASLYPAPRNVDETIALVGLQGKEDGRSRTLSGGQRRRLDLALALIGDPDLVFLDEPTTGFDPQARRAAWETIRSLRSLGTTIVLTTHYLDEAQELADRVAIIKDGRVVAEGTPQDIGGATAHQARVSWTDEYGAKQEIETDMPTKLLHEITGTALAAGRELTGLKVSRPSLEDIYLDLTMEEPGDE